MPVNPNIRVEVIIQLTVNGRPFWVKAIRTKPENTLPMTDAQYQKICEAAVKELTMQCNMYREKESEKVKA